MKNNLMHVEQHTNNLNAIVLYENVSSAKRAKEFCDRFENQLVPEFEVRLCLWSFSSLQLPEFAKSAAREVEQASLIIVALHGDNALPQTVKDCLNSCIRKIRDGNRALLAQFHGVLKGSEKICPAYSYLRSIASQCDLRFFSQVVELPNYEQMPPLIRPPSFISQRLYAEVRD